MNYSKVKIDSDVLEFLEDKAQENNLVTSRTEMFQVILTLISQGYYDDLFIDEMSRERRVNIPSDLSKRASEHIKEFGYRRLSDAILTVVSHESELNAQDNNHIAIFDESDDEIDEEGYGKEVNEKERPLNYDKVYYELLEKGEITKKGR